MTDPRTGRATLLEETGAGVICPLCGMRYSEAEGRACRAGCPLERHCGLLSCPNCAYEMPAPTRLTRWMERTGARVSLLLSRFRRGHYTRHR